jgi:hypothetical protein
MHGAGSGGQWRRVQRARPQAWLLTSQAPEAPAAERARPPGARQALAVAAAALAATLLAVLIAWALAPARVAGVDARTQGTLAWGEPPAKGMTSAAAPRAAALPVAGGWLDPTLGAAAAAAAHADAAPASEAAPAVEPERFGRERPLLARSFVREVGLRPAASGGGYEVLTVAEGSDFARLGLQAGDVVHTLDLGAVAPSAESPIVELTRAARLELNIVRAGQPLRLALALDADPKEGPGDASR